MLGKEGWVYGKMTTQKNLGIIERSTTEMGRPSFKLLNRSGFLKAKHLTT
jgi:hypothetical protein